VETSPETPVPAESLQPPVNMPEVTDASLSAEESQPDMPPSRPKRRLIWGIIGGVIAILLLVVVAAIIWYVQALRPVDSAADSRVRISVAAGSTPRQIAQLLYDKDLIRSTAAFDVYTRISGTRDQLQAGAYNLSPKESTQQIVDHLVSGRTDMMTITFYPGATLKSPKDTPENKRTDVTTVLLRAGYAQAEIDAALAKSYDHPLFEGKPKMASLEGYIYGETYNFNSDATVEVILTHIFDVYYAKIQEQNIIEQLKQRGLNLYQGITLASIVQREVSAANTSVASEDQKQVAQVFYTRLEQNMPLGSDVTAYYGADQIGAERTVAVDTPYNTRIHPGLTPGPIAVPSIGALAAVASPAPGDYIYFLSGDDDVTYFAHTEEEHQANIRNHCTVKCAIP
jgi:UPF0755 protein